MTEDRSTKARPVPQLRPEQLGDGEREPRLAGSAGPGQRDEPRVGTKQRLHRGDLEPTSDERRCRDRQARRHGALRLRRVPVPGPDGGSTARGPAAPAQDRRRARRRACCGPLDRRRARPSADRRGRARGSAAHGAVRGRAARRSAARARGAARRAHPARGARSRVPRAPAVAAPRGAPPRRPPSAGLGDPRAAVLARAQAQRSRPRAQPTVCPARVRGRRRARSCSNCSASSSPGSRRMRYPVPTVTMRSLPRARRSPCTYTWSEPLADARRPIAPECVDEPVARHDTAAFEEEHGAAARAASGRRARRDRRPRRPEPAPAAGTSSATPLSPTQADLKRPRRSSFAHPPDGGGIGKEQR